MTRLIALLCLAALAGPGVALAHERPVTMSLLQFKPPVVNILVGDTVRWTNKDGSQKHDVRSNEGVTPAFMSGDLAFDQTFTSPAFDAEGDFGYHCARHLVMRGTIRVHEIWLGAPAAAALHGTSVKLNGLAPEGTEVTVERLVDATWTPVTTLTAGENGVFSHIVPAVLADYRATMPGAESGPTSVKVKPRVTLARKRLPFKRTRVSVTAAPNRAGAVTVLQRRSPLGWKAIASKRLGTNSKAAFVVRPKKGMWRVRALVKASNGYAANQSGVIIVKR